LPDFPHSKQVKQQQQQQQQKKKKKKKKKQGDRVISRNKRKALFSSIKK